MFNMRYKTNLRRRGYAAKLNRSFAILTLAGCCCAHAFGAVQDDQDDTEQPQIAAIKSTAKDAMKMYHLKALIVQVRYGGRNLYTGAMGESMTGVPATPDMHFRNGAMAFAYMSTMLLELIYERPGELSLDDKLSKFRPTCQTRTI